MPLTLLLFQALSAFILWSVASSLSYIGRWPSEATFGLLFLMWAIALPAFVLIRPHFRNNAQRISKVVAFACVFSLVVVFALLFAISAFGCSEMPCLGLLNRHFGCACGCYDEVCSVELFFCLFLLSALTGLLWPRIVKAIRPNDSIHA
jgi:hypothetical protein